MLLSPDDDFTPRAQETTCEIDRKAATSQFAIELRAVSDIRIPDQALAKDIQRRTSPFLNRPAVQQHLASHCCHVSLRHNPAILCAQRTGSQRFGRVDREARS